MADLETEVALPDYEEEEEEVEEKEEEKEVKKFAPLFCFALNVTTTTTTAV